MQNSVKSRLQSCGCLGAYVHACTHADGSMMSPHPALHCGLLSCVHAFCALDSQFCAHNSVQDSGCEFDLGVSVGCKVWITDCCACSCGALTCGSSCVITFGGC